MVTKQQIEKQVDRWAKNPLEFIKKFWPDVVIWDKLKEICLSVRDNRGTVAPSGHGVGKSFISAKIAIWWLFCHFPAKVVTTAPTWTQVQDVLWGEIRSSILNARYPLIDPNKVLQTEIKLSPEWFAIGLSTTENVTQRQYGSTKFQGFHSPNLLVIMDEGPGVDASIHIAVESLATGKHNRILKIGNPTSPSGDFYNNCYSPNWTKIPISCLDHPNIKQGKEVIPGAVNQEWIDRAREEWGENSPLWKAKVLGEFPDETEDTLIPLSWCEIATRCEVEPNNRTVLGIDPARFGDDKTIVYEIRGNIVSLIYEKTKDSTMSLAGKIATIHQGYDQIGVDGVGVGGGVVDRLREVLDSSLEEKKYGYKVIDVQAGAKPENPRRFFNLRAEMYWHLRERLRPDGLKWMKLRLPEDDELKAQLASLKIDYTSDGRIKIESKEDLKKRGLKSPDKCLIAGTKISTIKGYKNIEDIKVGEKVITPIGIRQVIKSNLTYKNAEVWEVLFSNGKSLIGTKEHKVFTNSGLLTIDALHIGDIIKPYKLLNLILWRLKSLLSIEIKNIGFRQMVDIISEISITERVREGERKSYYTELFGRIITGKFLKDLLCIILMEIPIIMGWKIYSWFKDIVIVQDTHKNYGDKKNIEKNSLKILIRQEKKHRNGINQKQLKNFIKGSQGYLGKIRRNIKKVVSFVGKNTEHIFPIDQNIAVIAVYKKQHGADVYNLTVEKDHCYYANDILVSNSDALAIAAWINRPERPQEIAENPVYKEFFEYRKRAGVKDKLEFLP